jgi:hypothetical protein
MGELADEPQRHRNASDALDPIGPELREAAGGLPRRQTFRVAAKRRERFIDGQLVNEHRWIRGVQQQCLHDEEEAAKKHAAPRVIRRRRPYRATESAGLQASRERVLAAGLLCLQPTEVSMSDTTYWESIKAESGQLFERLKEVVHEGNVRRVVVQHQGRTVAEFPLTAGVLGALIAPVAAAIGAIAALLKDCTIAVERVEMTKVPDSTPALK